MTGEEATKATYVWHAFKSWTVHVKNRAVLVDVISVCKLGIHQTEIAVVRNIGEHHAYQTRADRLFKTEIEAVDCLIFDSQAAVEELQGKMRRHKEEIGYLLMRRGIASRADDSFVATPLQVYAPAAEDAAVDPTEYVEGLEPSPATPSPEDAEKTAKIRQN